MSTYSSRRILLCGAWTEAHTGDDAILLETIRFLRTEMPEVQLHIACSDYEATRNVLGEVDTVELIPTIERLMHREIALIETAGSSRIKALLFRLHFIIKLIRLYFVIGPLFKVLSPIMHGEAGSLARALRSCNCMILAGGGYLKSQYRYFWLYTNLCLIHLGLWIKKPVYCSSQTYGPLLSRRDRFLFYHVFRRTRNIGARDKHSVLLLKDLGIPGKAVVEENDAALTLPAVDPSGKEVSADTSNFVALSFIPGKLDDRLCVKLIDLLVKRYGFHRLLFFAHMKRDEIYIRRLCRGNIPNLIGVSIAPGEQKEILSRARLAIGCRFHFCLFSLSTGVPTISLRSETKFLGLFERFEMSNFVLNSFSNEDDLSHVVTLCDRIEQNHSDLSKKITLRCNALLPDSHLVLRQAVQDLSAAP